MELNAPTSQRTTYNKTTTFYTRNSSLMVEYCKTGASGELKFSYYDPEFTENNYSVIDSTSAQNLIEMVGDNVAIMA